MSYALKHTFVASDHHFGSWCLPIPLRVFSQEQEQELIEKWNSIVDKGDLVYYNGDFCDCSVLKMHEYLNRLNGNIILLKGNHELLPDEVYKAMFKDVLDDIVLPDINVFIHHCPGDSRCKYEVYGHLHRGFETYDNPSSFCSCVQMNDGYPVSLEKILMSIR